MAITAKGADRVMPVSDSLRGAGLASGAFVLGGQHVTIRDGVARLDDGTIAGSITTMDAMLRLLVGHVGWDLAEAMLMMSTVPADALGLMKLGRIANGAAADLVVLDSALQVRTTLVNGKIVFQR
jgi:N-acetylglucosamine-6-phosphate deacetylase